jgi:hypothetical protein
MFLSVALTRVVPRFIALLSEEGNQDSRKLEPIEKEIWERIYATLAIADREGKRSSYICSGLRTFILSLDRPSFHPAVGITCYY